MSHIAFSHWLEIELQTAVREILPLTGGINSSVFKLTLEDSVKVVKSYAENSDSELRYLRETSFLDLCQDHQISNVPRIERRDPTQQIICMDYINGIKQGASEAFIQSLLAFIKELQAIDREEAQSRLTLAADSTFELSDLSRELHRRISERSEAHHLVANEELLAILRDALRDEASSNSISRFFSTFARQVVSPSDIGPHNCIWMDSTAFFIDFEYSGRDSNIKLGLDLLTHPDIGFLDLYRNLDSSFEEVLGFAPSDVPAGLVHLFRLKWDLIRERKMRKTAEIQVWKSQ